MKPANLHNQTQTARCRRPTGIANPLKQFLLITLLLLTFIGGARADDTTASQSPLRASLHKDGYWNTLCLPFSVDEANLETAFEGATLMELDTESIVNGHMTGLDADGTLYLNFTVAHSIEASKPYIIRWEPDENSSASRSIAKSAPRNVSMAASTDVTSTDGSVTFCGTFEQIEFKEEDKSILLLGDRNTLYWPKPDLSDPDNPVYPRIGPPHAYFKLNDITAGDSTDPNTVRAFKLNFFDEQSGITEDGDGEALGITTTNNTNFTNPDNAWYSLDGRIHDKRTTKAGLYIHNGRKVVMK